jgi:hypothetical protein
MARVAGEDRAIVAFFLLAFCWNLAMATIGW